MGLKRRAALGLFSAAAGMALTRVADACPENQYEGPPCLFGKCVCYPKLGGTLGNAGQHLIEEGRGQFGGNPLELWLNQSRNTSLNGAQPIPPSVIQAMSGYIDPRALSIAKYRIGDAGIANMANIIQTFNQDIAAVTLIDVIVFRDPSQLANGVLWAHELTHVTQFLLWQTHNFAVSYARDWHSVEDPAYAAGNGFPEWRANQNQFVAQQQQQQLAPPYYPFGNQQPVTPFGNSPLTDNDDNN